MLVNLTLMGSQGGYLGVNIFRALKGLIGEVQYLFTPGKPAKILFDHLPKCGGSSLNKFLVSQYPDRRVFILNGEDPSGSVREFLGLAQWKRHYFDLVMGHRANELLDYVHPESLVITVFRDPIDRIISYYYYARREKRHYLHQQLNDLDMSLDEFAMSDITDENRNYYTCHFLGIDAVEAEKNPDASVARALELVSNRYDIIGFLDAMPQFMEDVCKQAGLKGDGGLQKLNETKDRPPKNDISESTIKRIEEMNLLDVKLYQQLRTIKCRG